MAGFDEPIEIEGDDEPIEIGSTDEPIKIEGGEQPLEAGSSMIQAFGKKSRHVDQWDRTPNVTGTGAIHCKLFHCKLREDALEYLEQQINLWLDKHPEYEVKQVTSAIGELKQKTGSEPAIFITIWV